jgi:predicted amidophosphoribosyltransferase
MVRRTGGSVQKMLGQEQRAKNAFAAFEAVPKHCADLKGKCVILVDDVVTTGAGLSECARILYGCGAKRVLCVAIAADDVNRDVGVKGRISRDAHSI